MITACKPAKYTVDSILRRSVSVRRCPAGCQRREKTFSAATLHSSHCYDAMNLHPPTVMVLTTLLTIENAAGTEVEAPQKSECPDFATPPR